MLKWATRRGRILKAFDRKQKLIKKARQAEYVWIDLEDRFSHSDNGYTSSLHSLRYFEPTKQPEEVLSQKDLKFVTKVPKNSHPLEILAIKSRYQQVMWAFTYGFVGTVFEYCNSWLRE